jgi:hypothetical protein
MVGQSITITDDGTHTISAYTSASQLTLSSGASSSSNKTWSMTPSGTYQMPDEFGGLIGRMTYPTGDGIVAAVDITAEEVIRDHKQRNSATGRPTAAAIRPKAGFTGASMQSYELVVAPVPDQLYTVTYRYHVLLDAISGSLTKLVGGTPHGETLRAACLAAAELEVNDGRGIRAEVFVRRLRASVAFEANNTPHVLGYNGDNASEWNSYRPYRRSYNGRITINGA